MKSASPKSVWAVPGGQSRSRNPSPSRPRSALSILTYSRTVDSATSTPSSSVSLTNILWAVWRCFLQVLRSSSSQDSMSARCASRMRPRRAGTGMRGDRSSSPRYL